MVMVQRGLMSPGHFHLEYHYDAVDPSENWVSKRICSLEGGRGDYV